VAHYRESLAIFQELRHQLGISLALGGLGLNAWAKGGAHFAEARRLIEESLAICRTIGNRLQMASHLADLAKVLDDVGEHALALRHAQEGLTIAEAVGSPVFIAYNLASMGAALRNLGELETSRARLRRALASAATAQLLPVQTTLLYEYAALLHTEAMATVADQAIRRQKNEQALDLLLLVADHPAGLAVYKQHAAGLIAELLRTLPQTSGAAPLGPRREQTLEATVTQILAHGG
jgi:tetratricopeptide (TPR) repeat protein